MGNGPCTQASWAADASRKDIDSRFGPRGGEAVLAQVGAVQVGTARLRGGHIAGSAGNSWLIARGCVIRIKWTQAPGDAVGFNMQPPILLPEVIPVPFKVAQVAAGESHALLLVKSAEPRVYACGSNDYGQLGLGDTLKRNMSQAWEVKELPPSALVDTVAAGCHVSMATSQRGSVWSWGRNEESGVLGQGVLPVACVTVPSSVMEIRGKVRAIQVATSGWTSLCISHLGGVYSWGGGLCGAHGQGHQEDESSPKAVRTLEGSALVQVAMGALHALALSSVGEVYTWGRVGGAFGMQAQLQLVPKAVDALEGKMIVQVAAGGEFSMALAESGEAYGWGFHASGALGRINLQDSGQMCALVHQLMIGPAGFPIRELGAGRCHSLVLVERERGEEERDKFGSGELWACGLRAAATEHVAHQWAGQPAARAGWGQPLAVPLGRPLEPMLIDAKKVLALMG
eukprot:gnl/TRDRNA2_/TRDRNA2_81344_c0_seq1.p1 gnl/TRDRNA2_/TRDRNA2_81344_c0~~gnl/TRDRNA2_/TRDRNA2_81344_c0_seq1.p1  ORF type:complete len:457 (+),score=85.98 gnl/TRDRNA2_/TRDRNA2_81344_c0_seq1:140-1510(+)